MAGIMLGNQTVSQIESRLNIKLTEEQKELLNSTRQENVSVPLGEGKWHCYDIPFTMVCDSKKTADAMVKLFTSHDLSKAERFGITWEKN